MEKLYTLNAYLSRIPKLGRLQVFAYPVVLFALLAAAIILIAIVQYFAPLTGYLENIV
jgi:hypothetical protein